MAIEKEIVDRLLANYEKPEDLTGENGVLRQLTKALMERALEAEMATHLGYERHDQEAKPNGNRRNGKSKKTLKGDFGEIEIATPRGIGRPRSSPGSSPRARPAWRGWMPRSCRCTRVALPRGTSRCCWARRTAVRG